MCCVMQLSSKWNRISEKGKSRRKLLRRQSLAGPQACQALGWEQGRPFQADADTQEPVMTTLHTVSIQ